MKNDSGLMVTGDKVLVRPVKVEERTVGGILLPNVSQDKEQMAQQMGYLVGIGPAAVGRSELDGISLGDLVLFPRYPGQEFPVDGERYWIMRVDAILGKATKLPDYVIRGAESSLSVFGGVLEQKVA